MFPQLTSFFDWIETNLINGLAAGVFDFFKNFAIIFAEIQPFLDFFFGMFSVLGNIA